MTIESAIPAYLTVERSRPRRVPDSYALPYPSYVARNAQAVRQVVMAYFGLQPGGQPPPLDALDAALAGLDGAGHHDRATGDGEIVTAAYWSDPAVFDRWWAAQRLYHEVAVLPADGQVFEYVDCRPGTGLF